MTVNLIPIIYVTVDGIFLRKSIFFRISVWQIYEKIKAFKWYVFVDNAFVHAFQILHLKQRFRYHQNLMFLICFDFKNFHIKVNFTV